MVAVTGRLKRLRACISRLEENLVQVCSAADDSSESSSNEEEEEPECTQKNFAVSPRLRRQGAAPEHSVRQVSARKINYESRSNGGGNNNTSECNASLKAQQHSTADDFRQPQRSNVQGGTSASSVVAERNGESQFLASRARHQVTAAASGLSVLLLERAVQQVRVPRSRLSQRLRHLQIFKPA